MNSILPLIVVVLSLEGVTPELSLPREESIVVSRTAAVSTEQVMENLADPFDLHAPRHWILSAFPMPYEIKAGSLNAGDMHVVKTRYHRWFVTNTHEGELHLKIAEVEPNRVRTEFVRDTTYFSKYLRVYGTQIELEDAGDGQTQISLRINYRRDLDPAWYFGPLQRFAVARMGEFLIDTIMIRDAERLIR